MKLHSTIEQATCHITLSGDFDAEGAQATREKIEALCVETCFNKVEIDMLQVDFLDSSGIGALVYLFKRLKANNSQLLLMGVKGQPAELMRLLRVDQAISIQWDNDYPQGLTV